MKARAIDVRHSVGRVLLSAVFHSSGKKLLAKGHRLEGQDVLMLQAEEMSEVWVAELEEGDVSEDEAVMQIAVGIGNGAIEVRLAAGGRANLFATEPCCVLVDGELLKQINSTDGLVIATSLNFSYTRAGQRISTVKSAPFAVTRARLDAILSLLSDNGPILQARPIRSPLVGLLYTDPGTGARASQLFGTIMAQRLERLGSLNNPSLTVPEDEAAVAGALLQLLDSRPAVILVASTTAPAGPYDTVGRAMVRIGCQIERFLAPVEPGTLLLLGYKDDVPIVSAPGCFRSTKRNVLDLILPALLARYHVSNWDIGSLGHGGLLD